MASAARELEPDPLPSDLSNRAPILSDVERGYVKDDAPYNEVEREGKEDSQNDRRASTAQSGGVKHDGDGERSKHEKAKGAGLTEGDDEMDALPKNNLWLVMPS